MATGWLARAAVLATVASALGCGPGELREVGPRPPSAAGTRSKADVATPPRASLDVPFLTQQPNTVACTAACLAMSLRYFGAQHSVSTVYGWFKSRGFVTSQGYVNSDKIGDGVAALSDGAVDVEVHSWTDDTLDVVRGEIARGRPAVLFVDHASLPDSTLRPGVTAHHMILVIGYDESGFTYHNPWHYSGSQRATEQQLVRAVFAKVTLSYGATSVADRWLGALQRSDLDAALALYHPDAILIEGHGVARGSAAIAARLRPLFTAIGGLSVERVSITRHGSSTTQRWRARADDGTTLLEVSDTLGVLDGLIRYQYEVQPRTP